MKTHRTKKLRCPYCGRLNDAHAGLEAPPKPDDYSYCAYCHEVSVFEKGGGLRKLRQGEVVEAMASADRLAAAIRRETMH